MSAKDKLLERLETLEDTLLIQELNNIQAGDHQHNKRATFLRKGLGIVTFNILEDYIKERSAEMFENISASLVNFSSLPTDLQEAATIGALKALISKVRDEKKNNGNWLGLIQQESSFIKSTSNVNGFTISKLSLMSEFSNVHADDIPKALKCLNIEGGWNTLQRVSQEIFGGIPNLNQSYSNISTRRHQAAHNANFDYEHGWLSSAISEIKAISSSFDIILSAQCRAINKKPAEPLVKNNLSNVLKYRFLIQSHQGTSYSEKLKITSKAIKKWPNLQDALQVIVPKCQGNDENLIILNSQQRIINWFC